jgi:hypothetical protein
MTKRKAILGALLVTAGLLVGCSPISEGVITAKVIEPAHYYTTTICHLVGKITVCTPMTQYDDQDWRFDIRKDDETGYIYTTEEDFNKFEVGDYVKAG